MMSAWICDMETIRVLVDASLKPGQYGLGMSWFHNGVRKEAHRAYANEIGQMLVDANYASVNYRYDESAEPPKYRHRDPQYQWSIPAIFKTLDCYDYQSCEPDNWKKSEAYAFLQDLKGFLIGLLPGYNEAPWGISETDVPPKEG